MADFECCRAENSFRVSGATADPTDATLTADDPAFCYADPAHSTGATSDPQQTALLRSPTELQGFCATFDREGRDDTCMPDVPECNNWLGPEHWPRDEFVTVSAWCICGPKLESKIEAGSYVSRGSSLWLQNQAGEGVVWTAYADASGAGTTAPRRASTASTARTLTCPIRCTTPSSSFGRPGPRRRRVRQLL